MAAEDGLFAEGGDGWERGFGVGAGPEVGVEFVEEGSGELFEEVGSYSWIGEFDAWFSWKGVFL